MANFTSNPAGLQKLLRSAGMVQAMHRRASRIANFAKLISPVVTGQYVSSWRIYSGIRNGKAWARVENIAPYAKFLEHGTRHMKRQRILGRAVSAARR